MSNDAKGCCAAFEQQACPCPVEPKQPDCCAPEAECCNPPQACCEPVKPGCGC